MFRHRGMLEGWQKWVGGWGTLIEAKGRAEKADGKEVVEG